MSTSHSIVGRDEVLQTLRKVGPSTVSDLMRVVERERGARRKYRQLLRSMVREGSVALDKKGRLSIPKASAQRGRAGERRADGSVPSGDAGLLTGGADGAPAPSQRRSVARFEGHRDGFGFVNPTDGSRDVFIPPHRTGGAMHDDLVEYRVVGTDKDGRREGTVVRVAGERGQRIVGLISRLSPNVEVIPFDARAGSRFLLAGPPGPGIAEGVAVEIEVPRSGADKRAPARLVEILGPTDRPGVDIEVLIRKHRLRVAFPEDVLREAEALARENLEKELDRREDFSGQTVVTIDGDTAKDFDDAISVSPPVGGIFEFAVHIADVAHYVQPGSPVDLEARARGTSVYFPGRAIPMLPPALSEDVCSLKPEVPRLVQSVLMKFDASGDLCGAPQA